MSGQPSRSTLSPLEDFSRVSGNEIDAGDGRTEWRLFVKRLTSLSAASLFLLGSVSLGVASTATATAQELSKTGELKSNNRGEVTVVCSRRTQRGNIRSRDGNVWEISTDRNIYLNNYVGMTVTVKGDIADSDNQSDSSQGPNHRLRATNLVVVAQSCQR